MRSLLSRLKPKGIVLISMWCLSVLLAWGGARTLTAEQIRLVAPKEGDVIVLNGCVVSACNYLANVRAHHELAPNFWSRILLVRYNENRAGHAYCIWETDGQIFGYDRSGSFPIPHSARDPKLIASALAGELEKVMKKPMVVARAEFIEPSTAKLYAF